MSENPVSTFASEAQRRAEERRIMKRTEVAAGRAAELKREDLVFSQADRDAHAAEIDSLRADIAAYSARLIEFNRSRQKP
jgi:hypothetical protein